MDKNREAGRRGGSSGTRHTPSKRQSKTSGPKHVSVLDGRDVDVDKSRRLAAVRSSSLGKASEIYVLRDGGVSSGEDNTEEKIGDINNIEMGGVSEGEEEDVRPPRRRFKIHGKAFEDCSAVDPAAVPRKLRSAVNKRNRESVSPPLPDGKKQVHTPNGAELAPTAHRNSPRRSKQNLRQSVMNGSLKQALPVMVTKDEEEVAETLFALAKMVPQTSAKSRVDKKTVEEKPGSLLETKTSSGPSLEASKEKHAESAHVLTGAEITDLSPAKEDSVKVSTKFESEIEFTVLDRPSVSGSQNIDLISDNIAQANFQRIAPLSGNQSMAVASLTDAANASHSIRVSTELCSVNGLLTSLQSQAITMHEPGNGSLLSVPAVVKQEELIKMNAETSSLLGAMEGGAPDIWQHSTNGSCGVDGLLARSSSTKASPWPELTYATRPGSTGNDVSTKKLPPSVGRRQSWKGCAAHVYISHLILAHQSAKKNLKWQALQPSQSKTKECRNPGSIATNDSDGFRNVPNSILSNASDIERSSRGIEVGSLPEKRLLQDQQAMATSRIYAQQQQNGDFLSLSAGGEPNDSVNLRNGMDSSGQLHIPYLHPFVQHHPVLPFSFQPARFASAYPDQLTAAAAAQQVQWQIPQYLANPFYGAQLGSAASGKQQQQQQQQQQTWAGQLPQQYRPGFPSSYLPKWQSGSVVPCSQTIISAASPSLEALSTKHSPNAQQFYTVSSSSSTRAKATKQQSLPVAYDEVGGFRPESSPHLQLLCNADRM